MIHAQAGSHVQAFQRIPFVLCIECLRPVSGTPVVDTQGCFQPVVAKVVANRHPVMSGQFGHALQLHHRAPLVCLQGAVAIVVYIIRIGFVAGFHQPAFIRSVVVEIAVTVPADVGRQMMAFFQVPRPSCRHSGIVVGEVVTMHVGHGILAVGTEDALVIPHAVGIDLHAFGRLPCQALRQLKELVTVHRFVARVGNDAASDLRRVFHARVLPAVAAAVVEIRKALHPSEGQSHGVVLPQVAIAAATRPVFQQPPLGGFAGDDIDDAGDGV